MSRSTSAEGPSRAVDLALLLIPIVVCTAIFWTGIRCWFLQDDFAWLGLGFEVHDFGSLVRTMFEPKAQGTIRPLSERAYFMGLFALFGLDALPFRVVTFLTQAVNLGLLAAIARRLTRSRVAAVAAPLLWGLNAALAIPLTWTSSYNQILCATFLMSAFLFFLNYVETGQRRYYFLQCGLFLLGFGALEINVVYPALATAYALVASRRHLLSTAPLWVVSVLYALLHNYVAPTVDTGPYAMHMDGSMLHTFLQYWIGAFAWPRLAPLVTAGWIKTLSVVAPWLITAVLLACLICPLLRRRWPALFPYLWFVVTIAPVLPLRDHLSDYYLTVPTIGLALAGAAAFAAAWSRAWPLRVAACAIAALYLTGSIPVAQSVLRFNHARSVQMRDLVWSVERVHELHPGKTILLLDVSSTAYWAGIHDDPFRLLGIRDVWLVPGSEDRIEAHPELGDISERVLPRIATLRALDRQQAVVYNVASYPIRNLTTAYHSLAKAAWKPELARHIDAGSPLFDDHIGPGWYELQGGVRWMSRRAVVWLGLPRRAGATLRIVGYCPAEQVAGRALKLEVAVNGHAMPALSITQPNAQFFYQFPLPQQAVSGDRLEVVLQVDQTLKGEDRELGLAFGTLAVR